MLGTIYRSDVMSDIYHSGVQFNLDYKFCSYTTNTENQSADIKLSLPANKKITIYWGDDTSTVITGAVTTITYSHTYADIGTYNLTVSGDYNDITYLLFDGDGSYGGDIKYFPSGLTYFHCYGNNTLSGDIQYLSPNLTYLLIKGNNTLTGDIQYLPFNLTFLRITGNNTLIGDIQYLPPNLTVLFIEGNNTLLGDIQYLPSSLTYLRVAGVNTLTGNIQYLPFSLTYLFIKGHNTLSGDIQYSPDGLTYFEIRGYNTISDYTSKTWTTNLSMFTLKPVSPGGLSSVEMDQLIIDLDNDLDWSGGGQIILTGTNAPRTSASDDAVNNIVAEGGTVICND